MGAHEHHRTMLLTLTLLTLLHMGLVSSADDAATPVVAIVHAESAAAASSVDSTDDSSLFDLDRAESKDPGGIAPKLEIIKQIRRLNSDGSYTVGYEADDGTFKIESRDVLGNVKGTYGYVDVNGEIKRVSYTAGTNATVSSTSRTTSLKSAEDSPAPSSRNRTAAAAASSTTRRPAALAYLTTSSAQTSPTRATVIQAIPKKTRIAPSASSGGSSSERPTFNHHQHHHYASTPRHSNNELVSPSPTTRGIKVSGGEPTTTVVYATSVPTNRPIPPSSGLINIRPTPLPGTYKTVEQLMRPDKLEITDHVSKVQISSNRDTSTAKPVTELVDEKLPSPSASSSDSAEEKRTTRGSFVTRPTHHQQDGHDEAVEAQQQVIYSQSAGDDSSHVYGGANPPGGTSRPVFAATPTTRIPSAVLAARSRAAQLQNAINQQQLAKQQQQQQLLQQQQNDKVYAKPPRRRPEAREDVGGDQTAGEPSSENQYVAAQRPATVQIVAPPASRELPDDEKRVYRRPVAFAQNVPQAYRSREFVRQAPAPSADYADYAAGPRQFRIPIPQAYPAQYQQPQPVLARPVYAEQQQVEDVEAPDQQQQYLRETTHMSARPAAAASTNEAEYPAYRPRGNGRQYLPYQPVAANSRAIADADPYDPYAPPPHHLHHAQHHNPYSPYHNRAPLPSQLFQHPDRPLTARDFERLLNLLVIRHQQLQRYQPGYNPYQQIPGPYHHQQPGPYGYQQQIPRPPVYNPYDPRLSGLIRPPLYGEFSDQDAAFQTPSAPPGAEGQTRQQQARPTAKRPVYYSSERPEYSEASQPIGVQQQQQEPEYLPADIREELLYRMLLLAMQPSQSGAASEGAAAAALEQSEASSPEYASLGTTTSKPASLQAKFRKPVRSVQILGEE